MEEQPKKENIARAPYNFVPFSTSVLQRYESAADIPAQDVLDPTLHSGEITITMTADTPVFVGNGAQHEEAHFFRDPSGHYALPGSSVRGMTRENVHILGFGLMRPNEDIGAPQLYFREMAAASDSTGNDLKKYYGEVLQIETVKGADGKSRAFPKAVKAGYLHCGGGSYYILPAKDSYLRIPRGNPDLAACSDISAEVRTVYYQQNANRVALRFAAPAEDGWKCGTLLFTGRPVGNKPNGRYLFTAEDTQAKPIGISEEDILSYKTDLEARYNSLKAYYDPAFWALPEEGKSKPVFYLEYGGHAYFGMSLFLRVGYGHTVTEGLPNPHLTRAQRENLFIDMPYALFGFATKDQSCRSRVSFGDLRACGQPQEMAPVKTVLGNPKPSWYTGYVKNAKDYHEDGFELRGYKQYWLKEAGAAPAQKEKVASWMRPLPKGTAFSGVVRFRNLTDDELGLLLWALRLEDGCCQSIGMGKPYGFGRMKLQIDRLSLFDLTRLYTPEGLCAGSSDSTSQIGAFISAYQSYAGAELGNGKKKKEVAALPSIQDFLYMHRTIRTDSEAVSYLPLEGFKNLKDPFPNVQALREAAEKQTEPDEEEDAWAKLAARANRNSNRGRK